MYHQRITTRSCAVIMGPFTKGLLPYFTPERNQWKTGSNEIDTCIYKYLQQLPEYVSGVSMFSDTCSGQNTWWEKSYTIK